MKRLGLGGACAVFLLACGGTQTPGAPAAPARDGSDVTAFVDVSVVPMDREVVVDGQTVLVRGDRIVEIGPSAKLLPPPGAKVIPGRGKFLLPGLGDMHTHLRNDEDLTLYVARGVTVVRNMWGTPLQLERRRRVERGELLGPRIYTTGPIMDGDPPDHDGSAVVLTAEQADRAVAADRAAGYDFVKVYTFLPAPAYQRIMADARRAGLPVVGHVPREVGLWGVIAAGQSGIEHMAGLVDALQPEGSTLVGKMDWPSRTKKIDEVDEKKIPKLVQELKAHGVWSCPTRVVKDQRGPLAAVEKQMQRPEMIYVSDDDRAVWKPSARPADRQAVLDRELALEDRVIRAIADGGARIVVGTDVGNPLVIPGFSVHDELAHFVRLGLSPYRALRAATADAAEMLGASSEFGSVAVGRRADLLLLDGNPLGDIHATSHIAGVMRAGHWYARDALDQMLAKVAERYRTWHDPYAGKPPLGPDSARRFAGTFRLTWNGGKFGAERVWVGVDEHGAPVVRSENYDPHEGQLVRAETWPGPAGSVDRIRFASDGASGRGHLDLRRKGPALELSGRLLPGFDFTKELPLAENVVVSMEKSLVGDFLLLPRLNALAIGAKLAVTSAELNLGSAVKLETHELEVARIDSNHFELRPKQGSPRTLTVDSEGWPTRSDAPLFGAKLEIERLP